MSDSIQITLISKHTVPYDVVCKAAGIKIALLASNK